LWSCGLLWFFPQAGNALLYVIGGTIVAGAIWPQARLMLWRCALAMLYAVCMALVFHLLADHFELRYVWLYSGPDLPPYLKVSNLWGGDEGTTLLLASVCMTIALRNASFPAWTGRANGLVAAWYVITAAWLGPFSSTPADLLAARVSQGMNAHLQTVWMAFHAPLVLAAYAWAMAPAGAALDALAGKASAYRYVAFHYGRYAWLVLTAGIGFGMAWALEDFTFGQLWHWDPVQTSVFAVWALLGAVLHGARRWSPEGPNRRLLPALSLLLAALACLAMAITRSQMLASSHRYAGALSWASHLGLAGVFIAALLWRLWQSGSLPAVEREKPPASRRTLDLAVGLFACVALLACGALLKAYAYAWLKVEKPTDLMPFFETLTTWTSPEELTELRQAFERWDIDGYAIGKALLPVLGLLGLVGGFAFLQKCLTTRAAALATFLASLAIGFVLWHGGWLSGGYAGEGVLSQRIVAVLPWLDAALISGIFLLGACLIWGAMSLWRSRKSGNFGYALGIVLVHCGAVIGLTGGLSATVMNSYSSITLPPSVTLDEWQRLSADLQVRVHPYLSKQDGQGYRAIANVELEMGDKVLRGHALFRDDRDLPPGYQGAVRQLCEVMDYRYARHAGDRGYVLHPFIVRGWFQDLQIWVPASSRLMHGGNAQDGAYDETESVIVVRRYPLVSLVWIGLAAMVAGMALLIGRARAAARRYLRPSR